MAETNRDVENPNEESERVEYRFTVNLNPSQYAKRFGIEIPDDQMDSELTEDDSDGVVSAQPLEQTAEDATVSYGKRMSGTMAGQCAATLAQCKAKNPMTCRFHGAKVIAQDIENFLRQQGVMGKVEVNLLNVSKQGKKELLSAEVVVDGTKKEEKLVTKAMQSFANLPGVDSVESGDYENKKIYTGFDIDILDPNAQARFAVITQQQQPPQQTKKPSAPPTPVQPQTSQPQTQAPVQQAPQAAQQPTQQAVPPAATQPPQTNRLRPPAAPQDPGNWTGLPIADMEFLEEAGMNLAFLAQRVNHNILKGDPKPGGMAFQGYQAIDEKRLRKLAQTNVQAKVIEDVFDAAKKSEANGWLDEILGGGTPYNDSLYNSSDPTNSTSYGGWGFDRDKETGFTKWKKDKDAYDKWDKPSNARAKEISALAAVATSNDPKAPKSEYAAMKKANDDMSDIEQNIGVLDAAIANETDNAAKAALQDMLADVESAYYDASKSWEDAKKAIMVWQDSQRTMTESFGYKEAADYYTSRGLSVPAGIKNWEKWVQQNEADADLVVASRFGKRKGWTTPQERQARVAQLRKNWQCLWPHLHIYHCASIYINTSIQNDGAVRASMNSHYVEALHNAFGAANKNLQPSDMQLYAVVSIEPTPKTSDWCSRSYNTGYVVELDPNHTIGGILYSNGCGYWNHTQGSAMNLISRCGLQDIAYGKGNNHFNPESAEKDFSTMTPRQMFDCMFPNGEGSMEFHPVNGASIDQQNIKHIWSMKKLSAATLKVLASAGIENMSITTGKPHP